MWICTVLIFGVQALTSSHHYIHIQGKAKLSTAGSDDHFGNCQWTLGGSYGLWNAIWTASAAGAVFRWAVCQQTWQQKRIHHHDQEDAFDICYSEKHARWTRVDWVWTLMLGDKASQSMFQFIRNILNGVEVRALQTINFHQTLKNISLWPLLFVVNIVMLKQERVLP